MGAGLPGEYGSGGRGTGGRRQTISIRGGGSVPRAAPRHLQAAVQLDLFWISEGHDARPLKTKAPVIGSSSNGGRLSPRSLLLSVFVQ